MAEESGAQEKTEAPTPKKREDSRKEGMVASSKELPSAMLLGVFALYFLVAGRAGLNTLKGVWGDAFSTFTAEEFTIKSLWGDLLGVAFTLLPLLLGVFGVVVLVALLISYLQVGWVLNMLKFEANRINPLTGLKRIFSSTGMVELLKSLCKLGIIGTVTYFALAAEMNTLFHLSELSLEAIFLFNFSLLGTLFSQVAITLVALALLDYLYQRWHTEQRMKMTKQEVREELKQSEGDPQLRSRIRQAQKEMSQARMMENVPKADVVVTNPTHYAVALHYDKEMMTSPRLLAKGADFIAQRIREVALENHIPVVENPPVARELFTHVDVGGEIPERFFRAVAEILAYVYRLRSGEAAAPPPVRPLS